MEMFFVFLWKPLNAALIAVWLFVPWGQITYNVISYVDPKWNPNCGMVTVIVPWGVENTMFYVFACNLIGVQFSCKPQCHGQLRQRNIISFVWSHWKFTGFYAILLVGKPHGPCIKLAIGHRPPCKLIQSNTATPNRFCSALHCFSNVFDVRCVLPLGKVIRNHRCPFPTGWWLDGKSIYNRRTKSQSSPMDHRKWRMDSTLMKWPHQR